jgi:predicted nucleotidyltransferase
MNLRSSSPNMIPRPRDYLETAGGLFFAVVSSTLDAGCALTSLRYVRQGPSLVKLGTDDAHRFLREHRPAYLAHSTLIDAMIHRVPLGDVLRVHQPDARLAALKASGASDRLERLALHATEALDTAGVSGRLGLGGSLLLGAHHAESDIDLVVYGRPAFFAARQALGAAIHAGRLQALDSAQWEAAWRRRGSDLSLEEYVRAEARKLNKAVVDGTRVDLTLVVDRDEEVPERGPFRKLGKVVVRAEVADATAAFDHPARYRVKSDAVSEVVSFTPTYAGQAEAGEVIEASGWLELDATGARRVVVGTSREARGEYVVVLPSGVVTSPGSSAGLPG